MNIVIYARFSSHTQTEQSIEGQLKVLEYLKFLDSPFRTVRNCRHFYYETDASEWDLSYSSV